MKLTSKEVKIIRNMANHSILTQKQIGGYFGVTQAMVSYIKNLKRRQSV